MPKRSTPPALMVVFGASGDLSRRKLIPSLYSLAKQKLLPAGFTLLGYARTHNSDDDFRKLALESLREYASDGFDEAVWEEFARGLFYQTGAYDDQASFDALAQRVSELDSARNPEGNHLFYLATPPNVFKPTDGSANNRFYIGTGAGITRIENLLIFDRWGNTLFESGEIAPNDPAAGWDGTVAGKMALPGVYVFLAQCRSIDGSLIVKSGDLVLIR